ncbi:hypothetical protein AQJ64_35540 [Streptomyces griseoruber]|uniref:Uncharacterized protein n=1 Tax=Streptomyces griseoruber TaxID=1943 RepID=A0A101SMP8_9ACTN|nr:hypothetical protein AQJ64_35540 [Streptomyces griseoruber]
MQRTDRAPGVAQAAGGVRLDAGRVLAPRPAAPVAADEHRGGGGQYEHQYDEGDGDLPGFPLFRLPAPLVPRR